MRCSANFVMRKCRLGMIEGEENECGLIEVHQAD